MPTWNVEGLTEDESVALQTRRDNLKTEFSLVCSHSCDIQPSRPRTSGVILCPFIKIPRLEGRSEEENEARRRDIANSGTPVEPGDITTFKFKTFFPLEINGTTLVADFSQMSTLLPFDRARPLLLAHRVLQLTEVERGHLKDKIASYFGRSEEAVGP